MRNFFACFLILLATLLTAQTIPSSIHNLCGIGNNENLTVTDIDLIVPLSPNGAECEKLDYINHRKYFYYKITSGGTFEFKLKSTKNFQFQVWQLSETQIQNFFGSASTNFSAVRSSYSDFQPEKGLFDSEDICQFYSGANGKLKPLLVNTGDYVVIGVFSQISNEGTFDIIPGGSAEVCEAPAIEKALTDDIDCGILSKPISEISAFITQDTAGLTDIKYFNDKSFSTPFTDTEVRTTKTIYAQVRDSTGKVKFVYTIQINFTPTYDFTNLLNDIAGNLDQTSCGSTFNLGSKQHILQTVLNISNYTDYTIISATYNVGGADIPYDFNTPIPNPSTVKLNVRYVGSEFCPGPVDQVINMNFSDSKPVISSGKSLNKCDGETLSFKEILIALGLDPNRYDLEASPFNDGDIIDFKSNSQLIIPVKVKEKGTSCVSNTENFIINKVPPIDILPTKLTACYSDFTKKAVDDELVKIKNSTSATLSFFDGTTPISETDLFTFIQNKKKGIIIVKAKEAGKCDTHVDFEFNLEESSMAIINSIADLITQCLEENSSHQFTKIEIEKHLKSIFGRNDIDFKGIKDEMVGPRDVLTIKFSVKKTTEACWSEEMLLNLVVINKPLITDKLDNYSVDCDRKFTITEKVLIDSFGKDILLYDIYIDGTLFNLTRDIIVDFAASDPAKIKVVVKNKTLNSCETIVYIEVHNKPSLNVDVTSLNKELESKKIIFCDGDLGNAKTQLQANIDYIKSRYPTLKTNLTNDQIVDKFTVGSGTVGVSFTDDSACGNAELVFHYVKNPLPVIALDKVQYICNDDEYMLNLSTYTAYKFAVKDIKTGNSVTGSTTFRLKVGKYLVTATDKTTGCSSDYNLEVTYANLPTIDKVKISENGIEITSKSKGKLEYSIDGGSTWQTKGSFINVRRGTYIIPAIRLDGCGVVKLDPILYLDLPNFISPNGDGKNDSWKPIGMSDLTNSYDLRIFDRQGKTVHITSGIDRLFWNGKLNGSLLPSTSYWYLIDFKDKNGQVEIQYSGSILLKNSH